eukprot:jgi/Mesvir1/28102/Mv04686-RA.4
MGWLHARRTAAFAAQWLRRETEHHGRRHAYTKSTVDILGSLLRELRKLAPVFPVNAENIQLLKTPAELYAALNEGVSASRERVVLASLYIGTGSLEQALVSRLAKHLAAHPQLRATVLVDGMRGTRREATSDGRPSSSLALLGQEMVGAAGLSSRIYPQGAACTLASPTLSACDRGQVGRDFLSSDTPDGRGAVEEGRVRLCFYRTPSIPALADRYFSDRFKEIFGVCHLKVYLFDDTVLLSGANLSKSYFTQRQDRYMLIRNAPALADFFERLVNTVGDYSFCVLPDASLGTNTDSHFSPSQGGSEFTRHMSNAVNRLLSETKTSQEAAMGGTSPSTFSQTPTGHRGISLSTGERASMPAGGMEADTWVMPCVQMAPLGIRQDEACVLAALENMPAGAAIDVASAYFNVTPRFEDALLRCATRARLRVLTAAPQANGFFGAKGVAGLVPATYSALEHRFYRKVRGMGGGTSSGLAQLYEYQRRGWTFHAKGIWCTLPGDELPSMTFIGSPNFGYRSLERDLEAQIAVLTGNAALQAQLGEVSSSQYVRIVLALI